MRSLLLAMLTCLALIALPQSAFADIILPPPPPPPPPDSSQSLLTIGSGIVAGLCIVIGGIWLVRRLRRVEDARLELQ